MTGDIISICKWNNEDRARDGRRYFTPTNSAKPISLVERCWCRSTHSTVPQRSIRELKFLHTPNCPLQVIAKLKNNKEVCINPETKWLQQYVRNAVNKMKKAQQQQI